MIWRLRAQSAKFDCGEAHVGQILLLFALLSTALIGVLGLATDLGISFAGRRSVQNAADAAALAGARSISKSVTSPTIMASTEVNTLAADNSFAFATSGPSVESCQYVTDSNTPLGSCTGTVPSTATGVKVTVVETHPTYFVRVVPGAPDTVTTRATAIAHVMRPALMGTGPFIVCASNTMLVAGGEMNLLSLVGGRWQINPAAVGKAFKVHGPQINQCAISSSQFKGIADTVANGQLSAPPATYFTYSTGNVASISAAVEGINGCQAGQPLNNCVAYLPVAVIDASHPPLESGSNKKVWVIGFAAFLIKATAPNAHSGTLLDNFIVKGPAAHGWTRDYFGPISIKLTD